MTLAGDVPWLKHSVKTFIFILLFKKNNLCYYLFQDMKNHLLLSQEYQGILYSKSKFYLEGVIYAINTSFRYQKLYVPSLIWKYIRSLLFYRTSIKMGVSYQIQGRINEGFYDTSVEQTLNRDFCYWKEVRNRIFVLQRKTSSLSCKIVLGLPKQSVSYLISHSNSTFREDDIEGIYVNILYDPKTLLITTGISYKNFSLDKSLEYAFDEYLAKFLKEKAAL